MKKKGQSYKLEKKQLPIKGITMKTIYVAGNPFLNEDSLPLKIMKQLQKLFPKLHFEEFDPTENFPDEKELIIMDTVKGITGVCVFTGLDDFAAVPNYSLHDFDLGTNLKLLKKAGMIEKVTIIGISPELKEAEALKKVARIVTSTLL